MTVLTFPGQTGISAELKIISDKTPLKASSGGRLESDLRSKRGTRDGLEKTMEDVLAARASLRTENNIASRYRPRSKTGTIGIREPSE
jgi:hypothetical protein